MSQVNPGDGPRTPVIADFNRAKGAKDKLGDEPVPSTPELEKLANDLWNKATMTRAWERARLMQIARGAVHFDRTFEEEVAGFPDIPNRFRYFYERSPAYPQAMAQELQTAKSKIQSGHMSQVFMVGQQMSKWAGEAQHDFTTYFLNPFIKPVITNQQAMLDELTTAMYAYEGVLRAARKDAKKVADECMNKLDSIRNMDSSVVETQAGLSMVGVAVAIASAAAGFVSGGTTVALSLGLLGAGITAVNTGVAASQFFKGKQTIEVMGELDTAMKNLKILMDAEEQGIANALRDSRAQFDRSVNSTDSLDQASLLPNEPDGDGTPNISDGQVPGKPDFHPPR